MIDKKQIPDLVFGATIITIVVTIVVFFYMAKVDRARKIEATKNLVKSISSQFDLNENFYKDASPQLDPWGKEIKIQVEGTTVRYCKVYSAGPDKTFGTMDDISDTNMNFHPDAKASGEVVGKTVSNFGIAFGKAVGKFSVGFGKGVKESVEEEIEKQK